jgi:hypothetical protein
LKKNIGHNDEIKKILEEADVDKDGELSVAETKNLMRELDKVKNK